MKPLSQSAVCLGRVLKLARERSGNGLRQADLAQRLQISASAVSQAESGDRPPREQRLAQWAAALEVPAAPLQEIYLLVQGLVPWHGDVRWFRDLWEEEGRPDGGPHLFLAKKLEKRLAPVFEAAGGAQVGPPEWFDSELDDETGEEFPEFLGIPVTWTDFYKESLWTDIHLSPLAAAPVGIGLPPAHLTTCSIPVPAPLRQPQARRVPRPEARPGDRLAAALSELTRREKDLALAYVQGLVDARDASPR